MRGQLFILLLITFIFAIQSISINNESYGCTLKGSQTQCCWTNSNGCCEPSLKPRMCTQVITTCCKTKVYDSTKTFYIYKYSRSKGPIELTE